MAEGILQSNFHRALLVALMTDMSRMSVVTS